MANYTIILTDTQDSILTRIASTIDKTQYLQSIINSAIDAWTKQLQVQDAQES